MARYGNKRVALLRSVKLEGARVLQLRRSSSIRREGVES
jgi:hypothetical protein